MRKNHSYITILVTSLMVVVMACQPDDFPGIGAREAIIPKLSGTWTLSKVIQRDNDAESKGYPSFAQSQDITNDFAFSEFRLVLNADASGNPTTFTIDRGDSPNIIGDVSSGNWSVDDINYPSKMVFTGGAGATIELGSFTGLDKGEMVLKLIRTQPKGDNNVPVVTYQYSFTKE